jgi:hypothetical protein
MRDQEKYTARHCAETDGAARFAGNVIVVREAALPSDHPGQLFCCVGESAAHPRATDNICYGGGTGGSGSGENGNGENGGNGGSRSETGGSGSSHPRITNKTVIAASLSTGEYFHFGRGDIVGTLKPEHLPDAARLTLSQVTPYREAKRPEARAPGREIFTGYCFLPDGRYSAGVRLDGPEEIRAFLELQAPYQHRVLICDSDDYGVLEAADGKIIYPAQEDCKALWRQDPPGQDGG